MDTTLPVEILPVESSAPKPSGRRYDFRHPGVLSSAEWRRLKMEAQEFVQSAGALLSTWLRMDLSAQLEQLQTISFQEFVEHLPTPTHLALFKLEPLRGVSVVEIRSGLALAIIDRLLGGPGEIATAERTLTEMEVALMDQFIEVLLDDWCKHWKRLQELRAEILGHENNGKFLQSSSAETLLFVLTIDVRLAAIEGKIQLAFPYPTIEPLVQKLKETTPAPAAAVNGSNQIQWNHALDAVPLNVSAKSPPFKLPARALVNLKAGEVLELRREAIDSIELRIGTMTKFKGRLGMRDRKWAVQITEIC